MKKLRVLALATCVSVAALVSVAVVSLTAGVAAAQGARETAAESRSAAFEAVQGPNTEDVPGGMLLVGAYGTVLALVLAYVGWLARLQSATTRDLDRLQRALESTGKTGG